MILNLEDKLYYSIGEVAKTLGVNTSLIRHWEKEIDVLKPKRNTKGNRRYKQDDIKKLHQVYILVKEKGMTLDGANMHIKNSKKDLTLTLEKMRRIKQKLVKMRDAL